jgi:hypothetical protein
MTKFFPQFTKRDLIELAQVRAAMNFKRIAARRKKLAGSHFNALGTDHPALLNLVRAEEETQRLAVKARYEVVEQWLLRTDHYEEAAQCKEEGLRDLAALKIAAILQIELLQKAGNELRSLAYARANACLCKLEALANFLTFTPTLLTIKAMPAIATHRAANAPNQEKRSRALNGITQALALER